MDLILKRNQKGEDGIFGELIDLKGTVICLTLEHAYIQTDQSFAAKIPPAEYLCQRGIHQLEKGGPFETFQVLDVPGHEGILFHPGNYNSDSSGCILLGTDRISYLPGKFMLNYSKKAFQKFMEIQQGVEHFSLTVQE